MKCGSIALLGAALALLGCTSATVGSTIKVPPDAAKTCSDHCTSIGLELSAVAIMANNVGCICEKAAPESAGDVGSHASTISGGMTAILIQQEAAEQAQQQQQRQRQL